MSQMSSKPINKHLIGLIVLLLICLLMPSGAAAQKYTLTKISGDGQIGRPGQKLQPFVVEVRDQNGTPVSGVFVTFIHDDGSLSTVLDVTGSDGRAESILTLGSTAGTTTITVQAGDASITFEAKTVLRPKTLVKISGDNQTGSHRCCIGGTVCRGSPRCERRSGGRDYCNLYGHCGRWFAQS